MKNKMSQKILDNYDIACSEDYFILVRNKQDEVKQYYCYVGDYSKQYHLFNETFPSLRKECIPYTKRKFVEDIEIGDFIIYGSEVLVMVDRDRDSGIFKRVTRECDGDESKNLLYLYYEVRVDKIYMKYSNNALKNFVIRLFR